MLALIGLDHPVVSEYLARFRRCSPEDLGIVVDTDSDRSAVLTLWRVTAQTERGQSVTAVAAIASDEVGHRFPLLERHTDEVFTWAPGVGRNRAFADLLEKTIEPMLHRSPYIGA